MATKDGPGEVALTVRASAYRDDGPWDLRLRGKSRVIREYSLAFSQGWYDFTVAGENFERRFAGRVETGLASVSDPALG